MRNAIIEMARDNWKVPIHIPDEQVWAYIDKINLREKWRLERVIDEDK